MHHVSSRTQLTCYAINICLLLVALLAEKSQGSYGNLESPQNYLSYKYPSTTISKSLSCSCGVKNTGATPLTTPPPVRGTHEVAYNEYPWQVLIFRSPDGRLPAKNEKVFEPCGGTIISDNMILTSANCIWDPNFDPHDSDHVKNLLFSNNRTKNRPLSQLKVVRIDEKKNVHELEVEELSYLQQFAVDKFAGRDVDWDIGLLKLKKPILFSDDPDHGIRPVCLPQMDSLSSLPGQVGAVLLWSYAEGGYKDGTFHLPGLSLNSTFIYDFSECQVNTWNRHLSSNFLCMETKRRPEETPHNGYPVLVQTADSNIMFQVGVTSYTSGYGSIRNMLPSLVFSNISNYLGFIEKTANDWGAQWCSLEPTLGLPPVHSSFDSKLLTVRSEESRHPWKKFPSGSRREMINCRCGIKNDMPSRPNAKEGVPLAYGWNVIILVNRGSKVVKCDGTLLNDKVVSSPAHCFFDEKTQDQDEPNNIDVYFYCDENFKNSKDSCMERVGVDKVIVYPDYTYRDPQNDIALLILRKKLIFQTQPIRITPICLPKLSAKVDLIGRTDACVTRWVSTSSNSTTQNMKALEANILSMDKCKKITSQVNTILTQMQIRNLDENLCLRVDKATYGKYQKFDDAGGPLFLTRNSVTNASIGSNNHKPQYFLVGIFQWGDMWDILSRHRLHHTGVTDDTEIVEAYTNVQDYIQFIEYYTVVHEGKWCSASS